ncbi:MAG: N-acetylneuraminate synthase family protein, partial [Alphaproteobacteria bacterium]|nr:N-acetylneuraminate synthase family protein [Alphaproteobacteria bacterium]
FQSWGTGLFSQSVYDANAELKAAVAAYAVAESDMAALAAYCRETEIDFASTPCSATEMVALDALDPPFVKIASMDLNHDRMLIDAAKTGRPIILSTGFSTLSEIEHALTTLEGVGHTDTVLLHCTSIYPPADELVNLRNIEMLHETFGYPVGYSDHTIGVEVTLAAIALGAAVIEKHFTLDKTLPGWDHAVSADPGEMAIICSAARRIPAALGTRRRIVSEGERQNSEVMRRSIVAARDIRAGEILSEAHLEFRRPGTGINPNDADLLLGATVRRDIAADTLFALDDVERVPSPAERAA